MEYEKIIGIYKDICETTGFFFFCGCFLHLELMFLETSALTGENVEEAFLKCARTILTKIESGRRKQFADVSVQ